MSDEEWDLWSEKHARIFGMFGDNDALMIAAWRDVFAARDYSLGELQEATLFIASNDPPQWRADHLARIQDRITYRRLERSRMEREAELVNEKRDACRICGGSGTVIVPHPQSIKGGQWVHPFYVAGVFCRCHKGRRLFNQYSERPRETRKGSDGKWPRLMDLDRYDGLHPNWELLMQQREVAMAAQDKAVHYSAEADRLAGRLKASIDKVLAKAEAEVPF